MRRLHQPPPDSASGVADRGLMVYAHYDHDARIRAYVRHALDAARRLGLYVVVVTTNALDSAQREDLEQHCDQLIVRTPNAGFDFYSWKVALEAVDLARFSFLITTNSSIFWPIGNIVTSLSSMLAGPGDLVGINRSLEISPHIQSYFLVWRKTLLRSAFFRNFWESVAPYTDKQDVIINLECRLEKRAQESGFSTATLIDPSRFLWRHAPVFGRQLRRVAANPTLRYPLEMLRAGSPCLKLSVFQANPYRVDLDGLRSECLGFGYPAACLDDFFTRYLP